MISIGNRRVIFSETLLCPDDETIGLEIQVPNEDDLWKVEVFFTEDETKPDTKDSVKPNLSWDVENDVWRFNFKNWALPFGATLSKPTEIAVTTDGHSIKLLAEVAKLTKLYRINLQIMIEGNSNE